MRLTVENKVEKEKTALERQIELLKMQKKEKIREMLNLLANLTQMGKAVWEESESLDEKKFIYTRKDVGFVFKVTETTDNRKVFEIKVINLTKDSKPIGLDGIDHNEKSLYESAERLYLEIDHGRLQDDEKNMDEVLSDLK